MRRVPDDHLPGSLDERFSDLLDGRLDPAAAAELLATIRQDPSLQREFEQFRNVVESLRRTPQEDLPAGLRQRILAAAKTSVPVRRSAAARLLPFAASLLTAAAAVLLFFLLLPLESGAPPARAPEATAFLESTVREEEADADGRTGLAAPRVTVGAGAAEAPAPNEFAKKAGEDLEKESRDRSARDESDKYAARAQPSDQAPGTQPAAPQPEGNVKPLALDRGEIARLSVLAVSVTGPAAEVSLGEMFGTLDAAYLAPIQMAANEVAPVSPSVAEALRTAASGQLGAVAGAGKQLKFAEDYSLVRVRGSAGQLRDLVAGLQVRAAEFRPTEQTIEGLPAIELQSPSLSWLQFPSGGGGQRLPEADPSSAAREKARPDGETAGKGGAPAGAPQESKQQAELEAKTKVADSKEMGPAARGAKAEARRGAGEAPRSEWGGEKLGRPASTPAAPFPPLPQGPTPTLEHRREALSRPGDALDYYLLLVRRPR